MDFDEWWSRQPKGDPTEPITPRMAWEAAVKVTRKTCEVACSQALEYAQGAEREACAKVCDEMFAGQVGAVHVAANRCAAAIRKRSNASN